MIGAPDLLQTIVAATERITAMRREREPLALLERRAATATPRGLQFEQALGMAGRVNVIAECKRRSPSKGVLMASYNPVTIARSYERGGAAAISVLTEPTFFDGSLGDLQAVRETVSIPVLRKDFIIDEYQLFEARAAGADAVLLIAAALAQPQLTRLRARAAELGLAALVEVHEEVELTRALDAGARVVGVNNRNLRTLQVDVDVSYRLAAQMPADVIAVSESGLQSRTDLERLAEAGYQAFLIGERFMTDADPVTALRELTGAVARTRRSLGEGGSGSRGEPDKPRPTGRLS
jgi:indole-3-glycerol phosphate synthase